MDFNLVPSSVVQDELLLRYKPFCRYPPSFRIIWIFTLWGGEGRNRFRQASLSHFSLLFSDHFVFASNWQLAFLVLVEEGQFPQKLVRHANIDLGLLSNEGDMFLTSYSARWVAMDMMQFYAIQTCLFLETISYWLLVVPLNNVAPMSNCPWVQGKANKPPPPSRGVCVCGGGGG